MFMIFVVFFFTVFLLLVFYLGNFLLSLKDLDSGKVATFESGFLSLGKVQVSFSVHFFIMMLMFIIFDLEVVMLLGVMLSSFSSLKIFIVLLFFVLGGFYMEWWYGKLVWLI